MHNDKHYPFIKVSMTALALLVAPLALQAQDKATEALRGPESLNIDAADQQAPGTTKPPTMPQPAAVTERKSPRPASPRRRWCPARPPTASTASLTRRNTAPDPNYGG